MDGKIWMAPLLLTISQSFACISCSLKIMLLVPSVAHGGLVGSKSLTGITSLKMVLLVLSVTESGLSGSSLCSVS